MFGLCGPLLWSRGKRSKSWESRVQNGSVILTYPPLPWPSAQMLPECPAWPFFPDAIKQSWSHAAVRQKSWAGALPCSKGSPTSLLTVSE